MPGFGGDHIPIEANGSRHAERGEDEHAPAQEREKCDTRPTVAAPDPMYIYITTMPHNNDCRKIRARMENEEGREGLKREEQRQDRHFEKAGHEERG